jgi:hypothetical protein
MSYPDTQTIDDNCDDPLPITSLSIEELKGALLKAGVPKHVVDSTSRQLLIEALTNVYEGRPHGLLQPEEKVPPIASNFFNSKELYDIQTLIDAGCDRHLIDIAHPSTREQAVRRINDGQPPCLKDGVIRQLNVQLFKLLEEAGVPEDVLDASSKEDIVDAALRVKKGQPHGLGESYSVSRMKALLAPNYSPEWVDERVKDGEFTKLSYLNAAQVENCLLAYDVPEDVVEGQSHHALVCALSRVMRGQPHLLIAQAESDSDDSTVPSSPPPPKKRKVARCLDRAFDVAEEILNREGWDLVKLRYNSEDQWTITLQKNKK